MLESCKVKFVLFMLNTGAAVPLGTTCKEL